MKIHDSWKNRVHGEHTKSMMLEAVAQLYHALAPFGGSISARDNLANAHGEITRNGYLTDQAENLIKSGVDGAKELISAAERAR